MPHSPDMAKRTKPKNKPHRIHLRHRKCIECGKRLTSERDSVCSLKCLFS